MTEVGAWGARWRPTPDARLRLFCVPHTGGGASTYRSWARQLPPEIELVAVRLPGRETRFRETPFTRLDELAPALVAAVRPWLDRPHAWFGHSLGALVAFEVCRILARQGLPAPVRLQVAGKPAPQMTPRHPPVHAAPTADLVERLRLLGGTPPELLDDGVLGVLLPLLRADFAVSETYQCRPAPPLDCPITVLGGTEDPLTTVAELSAWHEHSTAGGTVRMFDGGHFFPHERQEQVLPVVVADLLAALHGTAPDGTASDGTASDGTASDGTAPDGAAIDSATLDAPDGTPEPPARPHGTPARPNRLASRERQHLWKGRAQ